MSERDDFLAEAIEAGCPEDQMRNFLRACMENLL